MLLFLSGAYTFQFKGALVRFVKPTKEQLNHPSRKLTPDEVRLPATQNLIDEFLAFAGVKTGPKEPGGQRLVGAAMVQVDRPESMVPEAIVLIDPARPDDWSGLLEVLINPTIRGWRGKPCDWWHACYSCGPLAGRVTLPGSELVLGGLDRSGAETDLILSNPRGVHCGWHETLHTFARRFPDKTIGQGHKLHLVAPHEVPQYKAAWEKGLPWHRDAPHGIWQAMKAGDEGWTQLLPPDFAPRKKL